MLILARTDHYSSFLVRLEVALEEHKPAGRDLESGAIHQAVLHNLIFGGCEHEDPPRERIGNVEVCAVGG